MKSLLTTVEGAVTSNVKRQDLSATVEGALSAVEGTVTGAAKRQDILQETGSVLTAAGLGPVVKAVDDITKRIDPLAGVTDLESELPQVFVASDSINLQPN